MALQRSVVQQHLFRLGKAASVIALLQGAVIDLSAAAEVIFPGSRWEKADPVQLGWSRSKLRDARAYAKKIGSSAVIIVQDGRIVASWGDAQQKVGIRSVRKSFMSALYGIAVAGRQIDIRKTLAELQINDKQRLTTNESRATVRDLLMARSGIYHETAYETKTQKAQRPARGSHAPGSFWHYNNWDFNALGTILRKQSGEDTFAAVERLLARPLHMEDFTAQDGKYVYSKASDHPAYTMRFTARDLARFGWLYLNQGKWGEHQIVPKNWVSESTQAYSHARSGLGYGYLWWVAEKNLQFRADTGPGGFSARGSGGQYIIVAPARRIVVVHVNDTEENDKLERREFGNLMQRIFEAAPK